MKKFLGVCLNETPEMIIHFFHGLELSEPRTTYRSLVALSFIEGVLREAPNPQTAVSSQRLRSTEKILPAIIPSCVTKTLLGKIVQSQSVLLVLGGLKLIVALLQRANGYLSSLGVDRFRNDVCRAILNRIPEVRHGQP